MQGFAVTAQVKVSDTDVVEDGTTPRPSRPSAPVGARQSFFDWERREKETRRHLLIAKGDVKLRQVDRCLRRASALVENLF